jgi:hypothetical protein
MSTARFVGLTIALLAFAYWAQSMLAPRPLKPDARVSTFHRVDVDSPRYQVESSHASDEDSVRDALRHSALDAAQALADDPCNKAIKAHYIDAATNYARAWLSVASCVGTCSRGSDEHLRRLDLAQRAFGSPLDHRVWEAMAKAHQTDALVEGDFARDVAERVAELAADPVINPHAAPAMKATGRDFRTPLSCRAASLR